MYSNIDHTDPREDESEHWFKPAFPLLHTCAKIEKWKTGPHFKQFGSHFTVSAA